VIGIFQFMKHGRSNNYDKQLESRKRTELSYLVKQRRNVYVTCHNNFLCL
jgi:hypothetical protein